MAYPLFHPRSRRPAPITLSAGQFRDAFPGEGDHVEFKTGVGRRQIQATAVAFSNADGGVILVGVDDGGAVIGRRLDAGTVDAIHGALSTARDLGKYDLHPLEVDGVLISIVAVARRRQGFAQTSDGRALVRRGTRDDIAFGADLQRLINERSVTRFESTELEVPIEDVDPAALDRVRASLGWETATTPRLEAAGLASGSRLRVAGVLLLTSRPDATIGKALVEIMRYPDDETTDYDRRDEIAGPLDQQIREATSVVMDHLGTELVVLGVQRHDLPRIPEVVVREAIANAVAHRSYETTATPVRIALRPTAVTVTSPGALPEPVTVANIRETNAARNVDVMRVLRSLGVAEDAGRGVDVMQDTMSAEMLDPPRFEDTGHSVVVTLPVRSTVAPIERAWIRELEARGDLQAGDRLVLVQAARGAALTNGIVRDLVHVDSVGARSILRRLRDRGLVVQRGERGGASYVLADGLRPPAGLRLTPADLGEVIVRLAADEPISNADVRAATGLDRQQVLAALERLVRDGRLIRSGERRGTRYRLA